MHKFFTLKIRNLYSTQSPGICYLNRGWKNGYCQEFFKDYKHASFILRFELFLCFVLIPIPSTYWPSRQHISLFIYWSLSLSATIYSSLNIFTSCWRGFDIRLIEVLAAAVCAMHVVEWKLFLIWNVRLEHMYVLYLDFDQIILFVFGWYFPWLLARAGPNVWVAQVRLLAWLSHLLRSH